MAFNLAALGAGLGQFSQDYQRQQQQALQAMVIRQQLQKLIQGQQDESLLGAALLGGQVPGFGGRGVPTTPAMNPVRSLPTPQTAPVAAAIPPAAAAQAVPAGMMRTPMGQVVPQGDYLTPDQDMGPTQPAGRTLTPEELDALERGPTEMTPQQTDQLYGTAGAAESRAGVPAAPPAPAGAIPLDTEGAPAAPLAEPAAPAAAPESSAPTSGTIDTPDEFSQYLGMFKQTDPSAIAQHIKRVRPDADDGAVWRATAQLMKLASGNMREQLASASMMKFLLGEQGRNQRAAVTSADRAASRDVRKDIATMSSADRAASREQRRQNAEAVQKRFDQRFDQQRVDNAIKRADTASKQALTQMSQRLRAVKARIDTIDMGMDFAKPEVQAERKKLQAEMDDLLGRMDKRLQAVEKATPVAE